MYRTSSDVTSRVEIDVTCPLCVLLQFLVYWPGSLRKPMIRSHSRYRVSKKTKSGGRTTLNANDNIAC